MSALVNGEIDFYENPSIDFLPILEKAKGVKLLKTGKIDSTQGMIRLNHLHPPFDNIKARQAMYYLINQEDYLRAIVGDPKYYKVCHGLLTCGGPYENDGGTQWMKEYNPKKALQLLKEAGYKGEPITVLAATDHNTITPATQVLIQAMREAGINVDVQSMDWGIGGHRAAPRRSRRRRAAGTSSSPRRAASARPIRCCTPGSARPATRACSAGRAIPRSRSCATPSAWRRPRTSARRSPRSCRPGRWSEVVYLPFGQWDTPLAYRADRIEGIVPNTGLAVLWGITKK